MRAKKLGTAVVALLATLCIAGAATAREVKTGGTLNVDLATDVDFTDPALSYLSTGWELEYATCLKLMNYPDGMGPKTSQLIPEAAAGFPKVSNSGKTYDFTIATGFTKFSDGSKVTAASFKAAFDRNADPKMQSPATAFMSDVVGASTSPVSGVKVSGSHLLITLTKASPDFLARTAMPFFCAIPANTPRDPNGVLTLPAAGPYYIADRVPNKSILLKSNPYYKGKRPHNATQINYTIGNSLDATYLRVQQGTTDYASSGIPPAAYAEAAQKYGINKGQFWVQPFLSTSYLAFNTSRGIFKNNVALRKAVNQAIDRRALLSQSGYLAGRRTDQILPPGMAGFRDADLYPLMQPNLTAAKKLAQGHTGDGNVVLYESNRGASPLRAQIIQYNLSQIGLKVDTHLFARAVQLTKEGTRGEPFDIADESWGADYADPYDFINVLLDGRNIQDQNNTNFSYFNDPKFNQEMTQASLLSGPARYKAYGNLDVAIMQQGVPWAPRSNTNNRMLVSKRTGCFSYSAIYTVDLAALCLK
ncbi:MAG TPA: ABC transporter substrate-binding protein [Gaiellaceae bacterium]|jgi:ABC-type oligopeptide transport system substrate-binding subunit|nr:ABC transporter substrate-binding protein [Gaiellaceae bacterium]